MIHNYKLTKKERDQIDAAANAIGAIIGKLGPSLRGLTMSVKMVQVTKDPPVTRIDSMAYLNVKNGTYSERAVWKTEQFSMENRTKPASWHLQESIEEAHEKFPDDKTVADQRIKDAEAALEAAKTARAALDETSENG